MSRTHQQCTHLGTVKSVTPSGDGCQECLAMGDTWVHLRHARKHFVAAKHPIISSFEPGEDWSWCFVDEVQVFL